jgi:hypothetical protein
MKQNDEMHCRAEGMFLRQMKIEQLLVITDDVDMGSNSLAFILSPSSFFSLSFVISFIALENV